MIETEPIHEMPRIIEMYQLINKKEKSMMSKLQEIQELKTDVNSERAELVEYYREFTKQAYTCSGGSGAFLNNMLTSGQDTTEEQHEKAINFLNDEDDL